MLAVRGSICLILLFIVVTINTASSQQFGGGGSGRRTGSSRDVCSKVALKNGKIKLRSNGRVVKFSCNRDYVLVGESTSTCLQGEWTSEPPVCATKGCPNIPSPPSGRFVSSNGGAVLRLECNPGYIPSTSPMIYCVDRFDWNGTAPLCQASGVHQSAMRCDFETDDLCGWVQDTTTDEFDWTWQNYGTPSNHLSTGPSFDHTLGQGKNGHYLFIESSSPRVPNDTARLFSPVYGAPEASSVAEGVCFAFWFHMFGSTTGQLNVFIKPESKKLTELKPAWSRSGNQGNQWRQGYISLDTVTENFQVVIEGVRGSGYVGDSAIDDVQLTRGEECLAALRRMMADTVVPGSKTSDEPTSTVAPNASCASRCSDAAANNVTDNWTCGCSDDCLLKNSCCIDYAAFCLTGRNDTRAGSTDAPTSSTSTMKKDNETISSTTTSRPSGDQTSSTFPSSTASSAGSSTSSSATSPRLMTNSSSWTLPFTLSTTMSSIATAASTRKMTSTTVRPTSLATTIAPQLTFSTAKSSVISTLRSSTMPTVTSTFIPTERTSRAAVITTTTTPTTTTTTTTTKRMSTTRTTPSTVATSTTPIKRTTTSSQPITTRTMTTTSRPSTTTRPMTTTTTTTRTTLTSSSVASQTILLVTDDPQDGLQGDDQSRVPNRPSASVQTSTPRWLIGAVSAGAIGAVLLLATVLLVVRARRLKVGGTRPKPRQQNQLAEDSDVRYLRDDDDVQLDLTEATPAPRDSTQQDRSRQFADFERL